MDAKLRLAAIETLAVVLKSELKPDMIAPIIRTNDDLFSRDNGGHAQLWLLPGAQMIGVASQDDLRSSIWLSEAGEFVSMADFTVPLVSIFETKKCYIWALRVYSGDFLVNDVILNSLQRLREKATV